MKYIIDGKEVNIDWQQDEPIEKIDCYCTEWVVKGDGDNGKEYVTSATYVHDELDEVNEEYIEEVTA